MLDGSDYNFGYKWHCDGDVMYLNHMWLAEEHRGNGSYIIETLARVAYYEGAEVFEVSMGGSERAEAFLEKNGFHILRRRYYDEGDGEFGVDAVRRVG